MLSQHSPLASLHIDTKQSAGKPTYLPTDEPSTADGEIFLSPVENSCTLVRLFVDRTRRPIVYFVDRHSDLRSSSSEHQSVSQSEQNPLRLGLSFLHTSEDGASAPVMVCPETDTCATCSWRIFFFFPLLSKKILQKRPRDFYSRSIE